MLFASFNCPREEHLLDTLVLSAVIPVLTGTFYRRHLSARGLRYCPLS